MKKIFLLLLISVCGLMAQGATKIYVCGTKITGSTSFSTSGGSVNYDDNTRTLTITNVDYTKTGSSNNGISVDEVSGSLTINLVSTTFDIGDADAVLCKDKNHNKTTINVSGNCYLRCRSKSHAGLKLQDADVTVQGSGGLYVSHTAYGNGVKGGSGTENLTLQIKTCGIYSGNTRLHNLNKVSIIPTGNFGNDDFSTKIILDYYNSNTGYAAASNVGLWYAGTNVKIVKPIANYNADLSNLSSSSFSEEVIISDEQVVALLTYSYFPDANFRNYLLGLYPKGYITRSDVNARTSLTVSGKYISNLSGIEYFSKLTYLDCRANQLTTLPALPTTLETLLCSSNHFETLHINNYAHLKKLDISNNTRLTDLYCGDNALTDLNVANCPIMTTLSCGNNQLTDFSSLPASLQTLNCSGNKFNTLMLVGLSAMSWLDVSYNQYLTSLHCYDGVLKTLKVEGCSALKTIDCHNNQLTSFVVREPHSLQYLDCSNNKLSGAYSFSGITTLKMLNISNNPSLTLLYCYENALTSLNVTGCSSLKTLFCSHNNLTGLSLQGLNSLESLEINANQIKEAAMGTLVNDLRTIPVGNTGEFKVQGGSGEGNVITQAQVNTARAKRWIPKKYVNNNWTEIPASVTGDVNGDGKVNVSDVTALINMILGVIPKDEARADINGDGKVNVSDVTALVNLILS